ncbi:MAG: glycosyltransferase family 4 protein [Planctomycetota bacterium]
MPPRKALIIVHDPFPWAPRAKFGARALKESGWDVRVLCLSESGKPLREIWEGIPVRRIPVRRNRERRLAGYLLEYILFFMAAFFWSLYRLFRGHPALVHVVTPPDPLVFATLPLRLAGVPVLMDIRDRTPDLFGSKFGEGRPRLQTILRGVERVCMRFSSRVLTVHGEYRRQLAANGVPEGKISVVLNCPDETVFRPGTAPAPAAGNRFRVTYHGLLARRYGVDVLVEAAAILRGKIPNLLVEIYGDGDLRPDLERRIAECALGETVQLRGFFPVTEIPRLIGNADISAAPNRLDPFMASVVNTKVIEAATLGLAVVASRTPALREYFSDDSIEYCEPGEPASLAGAIERLYRDPARRRSLGMAAAREAAPFRESVQKTEYLQCVEMLKSS